MANFAASFRDNSLIVDINADSTTGIITIKDHSNYDDASPEAGHEQTDFSEYRKIKIEAPGAFTYWMSSLGDGDFSIVVPSAASLPITDTFDYSLIGDGVYGFTLYSIPTYDNSEAYLLSTTPYVYSGLKIYKCLQNSTGNPPASSPTYWQEITDAETLPEKYRKRERVAITCQLKDCYAQLIYSAICDVMNLDCNIDKYWKLSNWLKANQLLNIIEAVPELVEGGAFSQAEQAIDFGKTLCCCN
jgi:hypothetical protein